LTATLQTVAVIEMQLRAARRVFDRHIHLPHSLIDVGIRTMLKAMRKVVVFLVRDVVVSVAKEVRRRVEATRAIRALVERHVIVHVLSVIDCSLTDIAYCGVDFLNCLAFVARYRVVARTMIDHPARRTQVRERVEIARVVSRHVRARGQRNNCG
jgi:hypothetical protein